MWSSFIALMVAGSAVHTLWTAKGLALKLCSGGGASCEALLAAVQDYWRLAYDIGAVPGYLGAIHELDHRRVLLRLSHDDMAGPAGSRLSRCSSTFCAQ